jgi:hypothetical protein
MSDLISGQIATDPERKDGNWYFHVLDDKTKQQYRCISSTRYEVEHKGQSFDYKPLDHVQLTGELRRGGQFFFDDIRAAST